MTRLRVFGGLGRTQLSVGIVFGGLQEMAGVPVPSILGLMVLRVSS